MRLRHFHALRPHCLVCRTQRNEIHRLEISTATREADETIHEGVLHCGNRACRREYPVIDGVPLLIANLRDYVAQHLPSLLMRDDLSAATRSIIGDCSPPGSAFDVTRQHLSSYAWGHYGDLAGVEGNGAAGSVMQLLARGLELAAAEPAWDGPVLDAGCSVGRATFEMAEQTAGLVLGTDLSFPMLRFAQSILHRGEVRFPLRRVGQVYDDCEFPASFPSAERVDFWACDAAALPFDDGTFAQILSLNLLDCIPSPRDHLATIAGLLQNGGTAILSTPYDWSPAATPVEAWLGGHSQRSETAGRSERVLRMLLTPDGHPAFVPGLELVAEDEHVPWAVRLHDRSTMTYDVHLAVVRRIRSEHDLSGDDSPHSHTS